MISGKISSCFQSKANAMEALLKTVSGCRFWRLRDLQILTSKWQRLCQHRLNKTDAALPSGTEAKRHNGTCTRSALHFPFPKGRLTSKRLPATAPGNADSPGSVLKAIPAALLWLQVLETWRKFTSDVRSSLWKLTAQAWVTRSRLPL